MTEDTQQNLPEYKTVCASCKEVEEAPHAWRKLRNAGLFMLVSTIVLAYSLLLMSFAFKYLFLLLWICLASLEVPAIVTRGLIGKYVFHFLTKDDEYHCHFVDPRFNEGKWGADLKAMVRTRMGGWFRTNAIIIHDSLHGRLWSVVENTESNGNRFSLRALQGDAHCLISGHPKNLLWFLAGGCGVCEAPDDLWQRLRDYRTEAERVLRLEGDFIRLAKRFELLGCHVMAQIKRIERSRTDRQGGLGRSPHAQALREALELALSELSSPEIIARWQGDVATKRRWRDLIEASDRRAATSAEAPPNPTPAPTGE